MNEVRKYPTSLSMISGATGGHIGLSLLLLPAPREFSRVLLASSDITQWILILLWAILIAGIFAVVIYSIRLYSTKPMASQELESSDKPLISNALSINSKPEVPDKPLTSEEPNNIPAPVKSPEPTLGKKSFPWYLFPVWGLLGGILGFLLMVVFTPLIAPTLMSGVEDQPSVMEALGFRLIFLLILVILAAVLGAGTGTILGSKGYSIKNKKWVSFWISIGYAALGGIAGALFIIIPCSCVTLIGYL